MVNGWYWLQSEFRTLALKCDVWPYSRPESCNVPYLFAKLSWDVSWQFHGTFHGNLLDQSNAYKKFLPTNRVEPLAKSEDVLL